MNRSKTAARPLLTFAMTLVLFTSCQAPILHYSDCLNSSGNFATARYHYLGSKNGFHYFRDNYHSFWKMKRATKLVRVPAGELKLAKEKPFDPANISEVAPLPPEKKWR